MNQDNKLYYNVKGYSFPLTLAEYNLNSICKLIIGLGIVVYILIAIIIAVNTGAYWWLFVFLFGAIIYIPIISLPYYLVKVFIDMSHNMRKSAQNSDEIKWYLSHDEENEAQK